MLGAARAAVKERPLGILWRAAACAIIGDPVAHPILEEGARMAVPAFPVRSNAGVDGTTSIPCMRKV